MFVFSEEAPAPSLVLWCLVLTGLTFAPFPQLHASKKVIFTDNPLSSIQDLTSSFISTTLLATREKQECGCVYLVAMADDLCLHL